MSQALTAEKAVTVQVERIPFGSPAQEVKRIIERDGGVILTGMLTRDEVAAINRELDPKFAALPGGNFGVGEENYLAEFMGRKTKRLTHCVKYSKAIRDVFLDNDVLPAYLAELMPGVPGSHTMYSSHGIEIYPGETPQRLHRDVGPLMQDLGIAKPNGTNLQVNTLLALTEVTEEMGATRVIPGSHLWEDYSAEGTQAQTAPATMNPGDVLMINGKVLHGGGANVTKDRARRVLSTAFSPGWMLGEEAWPFVFSADEVRAFPKRVQGYLGFRSISSHGEQPGFLWRVDARPLEEHLGL